MNKRKVMKKGQRAPRGYLYLHTVRLYSAAQYIRRSDLSNNRGREMRMPRHVGGVKSEPL